MASSYPDFESPPILTVSALTALIKEELEGSFAAVWVEGELSGVKYHTSGHCYFNLKDARAQINCTLWRSQVARLRFRLESGMQVLIFGSLNVYPPRGTYSLNVRRIEPRGRGDLQIALEQLKRRLEAEGLFDASRKRPLPYLARRVGIVTSRTGAALQDMLNVITRRFPNTHILLSPARVQGEGAAEEVAAALDRLNRHGQVDVIIVGRGGGSMEDLWCFNEELVVRSIARSTVPVVSAVGHETDFTLADFVADMRAPTPSAAAEMVTRDKRELQDTVRLWEQRLQQAMASRLQGYRAEVMALMERLRDPRSRLQEQRHRFEQVHHRLEPAMRRRLAESRRALAAAQDRLMAHSPARALPLRRAQLAHAVEALNKAMRQRQAKRRARLEQALAGLDALSPLATLARGYAIAQRKDTGAVLYRAEQVEPGDAVAVRLHSGSLDCRVEAVLPEADEGKTFGRGAHPGKRNQGPREGSWGLE